MLLTNYISVEDKQLQPSLQKSKSHCNAVSGSCTKWHPIIRSMFCLLFGGESVRIEFLGFWPDFRIMMYGIDRDNHKHTLGYTYVTNFGLTAANSVCPVKYKGNNLYLYRKLEKSGKMNTFCHRESTQTHWIMLELEDLRVNLTVRFYVTPALHSLKPSIVIGSRRLWSYYRLVSGGST